MAQGEGVVPIEEVMVYLGCSRSTVYESIRARKIPGYYIGTGTTDPSADRQRQGRPVIPRQAWEDFKTGKWTPDAKTSVGMMQIARQMRMTMLRLEIQANQRELSELAAAGD